MVIQGVTVDDTVEGVGGTPGCEHCMMQVAQLWLSMQHNHMKNIAISVGYSITTYLLVPYIIIHWTYIGMYSSYKLFLLLTCIVLNGMNIYYLFITC